ncbi:hypothetical protein [Ralstonia pickettii]|uniref:hypothetical protein n=1 Tax=Ralstonia pickettii TaxID=329 RepID=UPI0015E16D84
MTRQSLERGDIAGFLSVAVLPNLVWIVVPFAVIVVLGLIVSVATFWKTVLYFLVDGEPVRLVAPVAAAPALVQVREHMPHRAGR